MDVSLNFPQAIKLLIYTGTLLNQNILQIEEINFLHFLCFLIQLTEARIVLLIGGLLKCLVDSGKNQRHLLDGPDLRKMKTLLIRLLLLLDVNIFPQISVAILFSSFQIKLLKGLSNFPLTQIRLKCVIVLLIFNDLVD